MARFALMNQDTNTNNHVIFIGGTSNAAQTGSGSTGTQDVGTLTAGGPTDNTPGQIVFNIGNSSFTAGSYIIESKMTDNGTGTVSVVKTGAGSMKLDGHNTFSGGLTIASGRVQFAGSEIGTANPTGGGSGPITILPGGQLFPSGAAGAGIVIANPFFIAGFGVASELDGAMRLATTPSAGKLP